MRLIASVLSSLLLAFSLLCPALAAPVEASEPWSRTEANGYVTMRLTWPDYKSLSWSDAQHFYVLYADTQDPVPLSSTLLYQGNLYATIPAEDAGRPLQLLQGTPVQFTDCVQVWQGHTYYDAPQGADQRNLRGILQGDSSGTLNKDRALTRAEAFALLFRLLSLQPEGDPGYTDVAPGDWYYEIASAARTAGLSSQQIRSIYVDNSIANWAELGGPDAVFIPYCRNKDSGSQAQMEEFFLNGSEIHPSIRRETTSVSMASVLTDVEDAY